MRNYRATTGPFAERPFFKPEEIEDVCADELRKASLFPDKPEPIRIERFIEKRFGVSPEYGELPAGVLGVTRFSSKGVEGIIVSKTLAEDGARSSERRINTTLAHEAGHGLLHTYLFVLNETAVSLFGADYDSKSPRILCRDDAASSGQRQSAYNGKWWEFQANQTIGSLLLPQKLFWQCLEPMLTKTGSLGMPMLLPEHRKRAVDRLAQTFDVNAAVARIRLDQLSPEKNSAQLTL
jgi:hypothetical protein